MSRIPAMVDTLIELNPRRDVIRRWISRRPDVDYAVDMDGTIYVLVHGPDDRSVMVGAFDREALRI